MQPAPLYTSHLDLYIFLGVVNDLTMGTIPYYTSLQVTKCACTCKRHAEGGGPRGEKFAVDAGPTDPVGRLGQPERRAGARLRTMMRASLLSRGVIYFIWMVFL